MTRLILVASLALTSACAGAAARDNDNDFLIMVDGDEGVEVGAFNVVATLGAAARQMDVELEVRSTGWYTDGSSVDLTGLMGLDQVGNGGGEGEAEFTFSPNTSLCQGNGFEITANDACSVQLSAIVITRGVSAQTGAATLRAFAPDDWSGDPEALVATVTVTAITPEAEE